MIPIRLSVSRVPLAVPLTLKCMRVNISQQQTETSYRFLLRCELNVYWLLLFPARYSALSRPSIDSDTTSSAFPSATVRFCEKKTSFHWIEVILGLRLFLFCRAHAFIINKSINVQWSRTKLSIIEHRRFGRDTLFRWLYTATANIAKKHYIWNNPQ